MADPLDIMFDRVAMERVFVEINLDFLSKLWVFFVGLNLKL